MREVEHWQTVKPAISGRRGVVAAQHWRAAKIGADILAAGGNAVDAAVATALALAVVEPWMSGLGGNGFMVLSRADEANARVINFQGVVPQALDLADYPLDPTQAITIMGFPGVIGKRNIRGYASITVPGAVAGLALALKQFGSFSFDRLLAPVIDLAEQGLSVDWHSMLHITLQQTELRADVGAAELFLPNGDPPQPGTVLPLQRLSRTLRTLAENGPEDFYRGRIAERMVDDLQRGGSAIDAGDLANYQAHLTASLSRTHRGGRVFGADGDSGARRLLDALQHSSRELHPTERVDADTYRAYARALNAAFANHKRRGGANLERGCTTHLSVADAAGNLVALTTTLLDRFGSQVVLPQTGIVMNNAIGYFDPRPGYFTSLTGGKRINSSNMCPSIGRHADGLHFAVGASGANHIVPAVMQLTALLLDYDMSLEQAFHTPRIDASDRGTVRVDASLSPQIIAALAQEFELEIAQRLVFPKLYACPSGVAYDAETGIGYGMTDPSLPVAAACAAAEAGQ